MHFPAQNFNDLPYATLNQILPLHLHSPFVHLSETAHAHIADRHPYDYILCMQWLAETIRQPDLAGFSPRHPGNFSLIKGYEERNLLVAISQTLNAYGKYPLQSCYLIDHDTLHRRIRRGFVKPLPS